MLKYAKMVNIRTIKMDALYVKILAKLVKKKRHVHHVKMVGI